MDAKTGLDSERAGTERVSRIARRIHKKLDDYEAYQFTGMQSEALNVFFDLAQEYDEVSDLHAVIVTIPKVFFGHDSTLHLLDRTGQMTLKATTLSGGASPEGPSECPVPPTPLSAEPWSDGTRHIIPIKGNLELLAQLPFEPYKGIIGLLEISPTVELSPHDKLFFEKYANRIGFQLHNRLIGQKNREHLQFIHNLVEDIGHNVIVPNMYFKLFYRRLEGRLKAMRAILADYRVCHESCLTSERDPDGRCGRILRELENVHTGLTEQYNEIYRHYEHTSLFLETLLRRSHFEQGHYVLDKRAFNFKSQVIEPQIERYKNRLEERGVVVDTRLGGVPDREVTVVADVGLISQVYANLFSNAVKYTQEMRDEQGWPKKYLSYGWETLPDHFGPGRDGLKLNVFSTGPHLPEQERSNLFKEGFRGSNTRGEYGTGHGLHFVKEVVELHGGQVGYEATPMGNNFFFILPLEPDLPAQQGGPARPDPANPANPADSRDLTDPAD